MATEARRSEGIVLPEVKEPRLYAVVLHNDDFTTMDFVVDLLIKLFGKSAQEAAQVMMAVHENGEGVAGIYPFDIAVTKKLLAERKAAEESFPLRISVAEAQ